MATSSSSDCAEEEEVFSKEFTDLNSIAASYQETALVWLCLRETLESRKYSRDRGREVADMFRYWFQKLRFGFCGYSAIAQEDTAGPDTLELSPTEDSSVSTVSGTNSGSSPPTIPPPVRHKQKLPFRRIWTKNVIFVLLTTALFDFQMGYVFLSIN